LINQLEAEYSIDPARIYVTGISNGGMLAYRVGREMSDLVAAIAPIAGCMYPVMNDLSEPVSVIAFNGTDDPVILFNGGDSEFWWHKVHSTPVSETINYWVDRDHCRKQPVTDVVGDVTQQLYSGGDKALRFVSTLSAAANTPGPVGEAPLLSMATRTVARSALRR
jgi:polyhydroxybutyrate depolymerase